MDIQTYGDTLSTFPNKSSLISPSNSDIRANLASRAVYDKREMDWYNKFVRFPGPDPYNAMTVTHEYLFFTKPDLHLINLNTNGIANALANVPFFEDAVVRYRSVCEQLQVSLINKPGNTVTGSRNPFAAILSNTVRSGLDLPDIESENDQETGANVYGTKITYRGNSYTSDQECSFSLEFEDTKYLEVYMFFKIYDEYCRRKNLGLIELDPSSKSSNDDSRWINYVLNKVLHDQFSVYKFVVGEDGITLIYWAKYTGVFPTGVPRSAFSDMTNEEGQKITVNFKAQFVRDMDPAILGDFNTVALTDYYNGLYDLPLYNQNTQQMDGTWSSMPYIAKIKNPVGEVAKMAQYQLRWKR